MLLHVLIVMLAGWINRHKQEVITCLQEEDCILKAQLGRRWMPLSDTERYRLPIRAHPLGCQYPQEHYPLAFNHDADSAHCHFLLLSCTPRAIARAVEKQDNPACRKSEPAWQRG